ncbi:MAG: YbjN domain-containing protein [Bradymonadales bacterium]|nr:YbjN domain-containing protein [Bradymonadales bacterium]
MRTDEDIEVYLTKMEIPFETLNKGLWVIHDENSLVENIVVYHNPPIVTVRVKIMPVPSQNREAFFEKLLQFNATEMVHGAYGIEEDSIVLVDTLQTENLDFNELQAAIDSISMAVASHYETLSVFRGTEQGNTNA